MKLQPQLLHLWQALMPRGGRNVMCLNQARNLSYILFKRIFNHCVQVLRSWRSDYKPISLLCKRNKGYMVRTWWDMLDNIIFSRIFFFFFCFVLFVLLLCKFIYESVVNLVVAVDHYDGILRLMFIPWYPKLWFNWDHMRKLFTMVEGAHFFSGEGYCNRWFLWKVPTEFSVFRVVLNWYILWTSCGQRVYEVFERCEDGCVA